MNTLDLFNQKNMKAEAPDAQIGDTVRVHIKVKEGSRERIQVFEGTVIAKKHHHRPPRVLRHRRGEGLPRPCAFH